MAISKINTNSITDNAVSADKMFSGFLNGITEMDQYITSSNHTSSGTTITAWQRSGLTGFAKIGTGISVSSGIFSFPSTGLYLIKGNFMFKIDTADESVGVVLQVTTDNSSYNSIATGNTGAGGSDQYEMASFTTVFNVTNVSTHKCKIITDSMASGNFVITSSTYTHTSLVFMRLGDSQ